MKPTLAILLASAGLVASAEMHSYHITTVATRLNTNDSFTCYTYKTNGFRVYEFAPADTVADRNLGKVRFDGGPYINPPFNTTNVITQLATNGEICRIIGHHWKEVSSIVGQKSYTVTVQDCLTCRSWKRTTVEVEQPHN